MLLKPFAELVTAFVHRYRTDAVRRTEVHIVVLQLLFSLLSIGFISAALSVLYQFTLVSIIAQVQQRVFASIMGETPSLPPIEGFVEITSIHLLVIMLSGILLVITFGYLMIRVAMFPARQTLKSQKRFISNIAHELRTPLSVIKTNTEVRLMDTDVSETIRDLYLKNLKEIDQISHIINNLLTLDTLVRPENLSFTTVPLDTVVLHALESLDLPLQERNIKLKKDIEEKTLAYGNASALEQIAINIIKNAILYTPREGAVRVTVRTEPDTMVSLSVQDAGIGIPESDLQHIFDPFYRADQARSKREGSGIGLTIVSELIRLHKGRILVRSAEGKGTTITVFIPQGATDASRALPIESPGEVGLDYT